MDPLQRLMELISQIRATSLGAQELIVPVSGGSDSALCFWLCCQAFEPRIGGRKVTGVHAGKDLRAEQWFESIGPVRYVETPGEYSEREEMRWARFLALSNKRHAWLVGSRNRVEHMLGTYSLASRLATYLPLANVWKTEVMELCRIINVPKEVLDSSLRADPDCGRPQEMAEISPGKIEIFLESTIDEARFKVMKDVLSPKEISYLENVVRRNSFKKTLPTCGI